MTLAGVVRRDVEHSRVYLRCRDQAVPVGFDVPLSGLVGYTSAVASAIFPTLAAVGQDPSLFAQVTAGERTGDEYAPDVRLLTEETPTDGRAAELDAAAVYVLDDCLGDPSEVEGAPNWGAVPDLSGYILTRRDTLRLYIPVRGKTVGADIRLFHDDGQLRRTHDVTGTLLWDQVTELRETGNWAPTTRLPGDTYCDWAADMGIWV